MLATAVLLALLLVLPGALLVLALDARRRDTAAWAEDLGLAVALSMGLLVLVGAVLGHLGLYRFLATGAPVVEAALLALVALLLAVPLARRLRRRAARPAPRPEGGA